MSQKEMVEPLQLTETELFARQGAFVEGIDYQEKEGKSDARCDKKSGWKLSASLWAT